MLVGKHFLLFSSPFLLQVILGAHAHLSKCRRGTQPEKVWEPLVEPLIDFAEARKIQETFHHVICRTPTYSRMSSPDVL